MRNLRIRFLTSFTAGSVLALGTARASDPVEFYGYVDEKGTVVKVEGPKDPPPAPQWTRAAPVVPAAPPAIRTTAARTVTAPAPEPFTPEELAPPAVAITPQPKTPPPARTAPPATAAAMAAPPKAKPGSLLTGLMGKMRGKEATPAPKSAAPAPAAVKEPVRGTPAHSSPPPAKAGDKADGVLQAVAQGKDAPATDPNKPKAPGWFQSLASPAKDAGTKKDPDAVRCTFKKSAPPAPASYLPPCADITPCDPAPAAPCPAVACQPECPNPWRHRLFGFGEYLSLSPKGVDLPYAVPVVGAGLLSAPMGPVAVAHNGYEPAYRVGLGVPLSCASSIQGSYSQFRNRNTDATVAPPGTVIQSLVTDPSTASFAGDSLEAFAVYDLNYKIATAEFRHLAFARDNFAVNYLVGAAYGHLDQSFHGDFTILGATTVDSSVNFDGGGPRAGLDGEFALGAGFSAFGRGTGSLLAGRFQADYMQVNAFAMTQSQTAYKDDRIVPLAEFDAGLGWTSPRGHLYLRTGYLVNAWFNTITTPGFIQAVQARNFNRRSDNINDTVTFDGLFTRVELRY